MLKQYCLLKHLWKEVMFSLHNSSTGGHLGILQKIRKRFYNPVFTEHFIDFIKNCILCLHLNQTANKQLQQPLQPLSSLQSFPGEMMQIDVVEQKGQISIFVFIGIDVFTKYLFAVPLTNCCADTVARELVKILFQHSCLPNALLSDLGTNFTSKIMTKLTKLLEVKLKHATLKQPQTIMNHLHFLYTTRLITLHLIAVQKRIFIDVNQLNPLIPVFPQEQCKQLKSIQIMIYGYKNATLEKFDESKERQLDSYQRYRS